MSTENQGEGSAVRKSSLRVVDQEAAKAAADAETAGMPADALDRAEGAVQPIEVGGPPASDAGATPAVVVAAPVPHQAAGIPSEHQDHALNLMSDTIQPQLDRFKSWSENISTEINARTSKFEAEQQEREIQHEANQSRLAEEHEKEIAALRSLQDNVGVGFGVLAQAVKTYNELIKSPGENVRDEQEGDQ